MALLYNFEFDIRTLQNVGSQNYLYREVQNSRNYLQEIFLINANLNTHVQSQVVVLCLSSRSLSIIVATQKLIHAPPLIKQTLISTPPSHNGNIKATAPPPRQLGFSFCLIMVPCVLTLASFFFFH